MIGGSYESMPDGYVANQRANNLAHLDGEAINHDDWQTAIAVADLMLEADPDAGSFLVVGCRQGHELQALEGAFPEARVVGIDIVPEFVEAALERGEAYVMDVHSMRFRDGEFDWIVAIATLEHCYHVSRAAQEMQRVARRGIYVTADLERESGNNSSHYAFTTDPQEWITLFQRPGWMLRRSWQPKGSLHMLWRRE